MTNLKCMFTHTDCMENECPIFDNNECFFGTFLRNVKENAKIDEQREKVNEIVDLLNQEDPFDVIEIIIKEQDTTLPERDIFINFLQDNNLTEEYISSLLESHDILIHYMSFYREACSNYPSDRDGQKNYFDKKIEQEKEKENNQRFEKLLSHKSKLIEYLKNIKAKKLYKKDIFHFYLTYAKINIGSIECDSIIRYITENGLYP